MPTSTVRENDSTLRAAESRRADEDVRRPDARRALPAVWRHFVVEFLGRGGMIHYAYQFCRGLAAQGAEVTLVTESDYELAHLPHNFKVETIIRLWNTRPAGAVEWSSSLAARLKRALRRTVRAAMYYREWWRLVRHLERARPDVVQFGEIRFATDLLPLMWLRSKGLRLVDVCHNVAPFNISPDSTALVKTSGFDRAAFRRIYSCFSDIFVHSEVNRREFLRLYGGDASRVHVIPHGNERVFIGDEMKADESAGRSAQEPQSKQDAQREQIELLRSVPERVPVVLFFGTLTKYKGLEYLIDAFAGVKRAVPASHLIIAGYPNPDVDIEFLQTRARELGIADAVTFHLQYVPLEDVAALFERAHVVVFPYLMIYQSGALQVAYSFGKPVVATDVGGLSEAVKHDETGLLVPPRDAAKLSEALIALLNDEPRARRMGAHARELSETIYSWDGIARRVMVALRTEDAPDTRDEEGERE
ncbi:MAG TPA: glycosyltransferase [Pyrinomonadaceae bacterium]|jgi:glycosyltransferase involved in cell wall biosynthesis